MTTIVALTGAFQNWRALLASIAEDDEVEHIAVVTITKGGDAKYAHFGMTRGELAFAALLLQRQALAE